MTLYFKFATKLSKKEFMVLEMLHRHQPEMVFREKIKDEIFGSDVKTNVVDVYVSHIRRKLGGEVEIKTHPREGYSLVSVGICLDPEIPQVLWIFE